MTYLRAGVWTLNLIELHVLVSPLGFLLISKKGHALHVKLRIHPKTEKLKQTYPNKGQTE